MKRHVFIGLIALLLLASCTGTTHKARQMARRAEHLADTLPDSTLRLIDSVLRMEAYFSERERMELAMLQGDLLFGHHDTSAGSIPPLMDDEYFDDKPFFSTSPELERAAAYFARKKQYDRAATAALYSGFVQQHYGENKIAMQSFKDAEQYGDMAGDSLAVAMAQCKMGKLLYDDFTYNDALSLLKSSERRLGNRFAEKALVLNMVSVCHLVQGDQENAEKCLLQSLELAEKSHSDKVKRKVLNNYSVLYRVQGKYEKAVGCLRQMEEIIHSDNELFMFCLNMGYTYMAANELDSAAMYAKRMEGLLPTTDVRDETKVSAYEVLTRLAKMVGNDSLALQYRETHEKCLYEVMRRSQEKNVYRIQRQYDHEILQDKMERQIILWHRVVFFIGAFAILGLTAFAVSQIRLARIRKQEADAKTNLFHFMQQNKALLQRHEEFARQHADLMQKHGETEKVYQLLLEEKEKYKCAYQDYAEKFSNAQFSKQKTIMKLAIYLNGKGDVAYLNNLKQAVFDDQTPWEAIFSIFDTLFPNVRENLVLQYPELTEAERKDIILSFFNVSRQDEADLLGITIHSLDKLRNAVRKKMQDTSFEVSQKPKNERQ